jgi:putative hydrolase of the HAD superfamily
MIKISVSEFVSSKNTIIFDLFHTLTALDPINSKLPMTYEILGVSKEAWEEQIFEKSKERVIGKIRDPFLIIKSMAHSINPDIPNVILEKALQNRIIKFDNALINITKDTINTLKKLKSMNKKIGLISNADVTEINAWHRSPIRKYFDSIVISCEVGLEKPDKEIYEFSLKELEEKSENAVFVGDGGSNELYGAKQVDLSTIMITGFIKDILSNNIIESRKLYADYVIDNINELV